MQREDFLALETSWAPLAADAVLPKALPVGSVVVAPDIFQSRPRHDPFTGVADVIHVNVLSAHLLSDPTYELDPVTVIRVGAKDILIEGHHRLAAYRLQERETIPVTFFRGTLREALIESGRENKKDRLAMSRNEKSERAWTLVKADLGLKVGPIMEGSGVSKRTVMLMRKKRRELLEQGLELPDTWASILYDKREANPEWFNEQVAEHAERLTKTFGPGAEFSPGREEILEKALITWVSGRASRIAMELVEMLYLHDQVASQAQMHAAEQAELDSLEF